MRVLRIRRARPVTLPLPRPPPRPLLSGAKSETRFQAGAPVAAVLAHGARCGSLQRQVAQALNDLLKPPRSRLVLDDAPALRAVREQLKSAPLDLAQGQRRRVGGLKIVGQIIHLREVTSVSGYRVNPPQGFPPARGAR